MDGVSVVASVLGIIQVAAQVTAALGASIQGAEASRKKPIDHITSPSSRMLPRWSKTSYGIRLPLYEAQNRKWCWKSGLRVMGLPPDARKQWMDWLEEQAPANGTKRMKWTRRSSQ
ncbi:hypothetical protein PAXRUDRAFT_9959 [Paxillus rubicundulus Ve08.2h10]|uniref:Uncharacterized protein n=1 Tax=Paxillus rubicundulus Ve08.2h10 TaxID=930991 RepID=A0A0D0E7N7_9AGAM|nr:hypothetical protein PAXRUDRAFT_9959 [Paxillus rubicundulus Ve08.2h10]